MNNSKNINAINMIKDAITFDPDFVRFVMMEGKRPIEPCWTSNNSANGRMLFNLLNDVNSSFSEVKNFGFICGSRKNHNDEECGYLVVDIDKKDDNDDMKHFFNLLPEDCFTSIEQWLKTSKYPYVLTPSGGYHIYFRYPSEDVILKRNLGNIDIQGNGKCIVYPGGVYEAQESKPWKAKYNGKKYEWIQHPKDFPVKKLPDYLLTKFQRKVKSNDTYNYKNKIIIEDENLRKEIIEALSLRADDSEREWLNTINALTSIGCCYEECVEFSKKSKDKYKAKKDDGKILEEHNKEEFSYNIYDIKKWICEDNNDEICEELIRKINLETQSYLIFKDDEGLSTIFSAIVSKDIKVVNLKTNDDCFGYIFNKNRKIWEKCTRLEIEEKISPILDKYLEKSKKLLREEYMKKQIEFDEYRSGKDLDATLFHKLKEEANKAETKRKFLDKIINKVNGSNGSKNIATKACVKLLEKTFLKKINNNEFEIPIKNERVLNLKTLEIRERKQTDYFTYECNVNFHNKLIDKIKEEIENFKKKNDRIQEDKPFATAYNYIFSISKERQDLTRFLLQLFGHFFSSNNSFRKFYIFHGSGKNGKSNLLNLFQKMITISPYTYNTANSSLLIQSEKITKSGQASPDLMAVKDCKISFISETEKEERVNSKMIKMITGGDVLSGRNLYSKEVDNFKLMTKLGILTNHIPEIEKSNSMRDRVCLVPFDATFEASIENEEYVKKIETKYNDYLFSLFVIYAKDIYTTGLIEAKEIEEATTRLNIENSPCQLAEFILRNYTINITDKDIDKNLTQLMEEFESIIKKHNGDNPTEQIDISILSKDKPNIFRDKVKKLYPQTYVRTNKSNVFRGFAKRANPISNIPMEEEEE
jgi:phage/plasmid-associated DNA primase